MHAPLAVGWLPVLLLACGPGADPAPHKVLHRLNRPEYDNTMRDLFAVDIQPSRRFPADDFALGFDNQAQALSISPLHVELYDKAADDVLDVLFAEGTAPGERWTFEGEGPEVEADHGAVFDSTGWVLWTEGYLGATFWAPASGTYRITADAYEIPAGDEPARMALEVDGASVGEFEVTAAYDGQFAQPEAYGVEVTVPQGRRQVRVAFLNDFKQPPDEDRSLVVDRLRIVGPLGIPREPPAHQDRVLVCTPDDFPELPRPQAEGACLEQIVRTFGPRAWRRPLSESEYLAKLRLYGEARALGAGWQEAVRTVLKAFVVSPHFVYRVEAARRPGVGHALDAYELASRLSYFLWSSMPDERLMDLAATDALLDPDVLEAEARRMLEDRRADALVHNLAGQWLSIRKIDDASPDRDTFPAFSEGLRVSMKAELTALAKDVLLGDRSLLDLLTTRDTFVDDRLAAFYGLPEGTPRAPARASNPQRPGWFTRAGLLMALSHPTTTSPVLRGKWVLGNLLCDEPPPPPDGVNFDLEDQEPAGGDDLTLREQLSRHTSAPECRACHLSMDPIGFSLEGFDGVGSFREVDEAGRPIDVSGEIPGLGGFSGPEEMVRLLTTDPRVPRCAVERTFTYALGRAPAESEADLLGWLTGRFVTADHRFEELVVDIVRSHPFRSQGPTPPLALEEEAP